MIVYAFHVAGGIQINREIDASTMTSEMVMPEDTGWSDAVAAAAHFGGEVTAPPIETPEQLLAAARATASMTRSDFLLVAIRAGIIAPSDAGPAARGEIPPSLGPIFEDLPSDVQIEAVVRWGAATMIERMNPVLAVLAEAMAITDEQLDALFGINLPAE